MADTGWVAVYGGGSRCADGGFHDVSAAAPRPLRGDAYCWRCSEQIRRVGVPEHYWTSNNNRYAADSLGIKREEDGVYIVGGTICNEEILRLAEEVEQLRAEVRRERERANATRVHQEHSLTRINSDILAAEATERERIKSALLEFADRMEQQSTLGYIYRPQAARQFRAAIEAACGKEGV